MQKSNIGFQKNLKLTREILPGCSESKEPACNAGNPGSIPGTGRSPGEGIGYPLHCSWASLVAQMVKNPPAMRETWVWSLCWGDPLAEGVATHSSILAWRIPTDRGACPATVHGVAKHQTQLSNWAAHKEKCYLNVINNSKNESVMQRQYSSYGSFRVCFCPKRGFLWM